VLFKLLPGETEGNHYSFPSHSEDLPLKKSYRYKIYVAMAWIGRVGIPLPLHPPYAFIGMEMEDVLLLYIVV
jgi:hypothetical protein